MDFGGKSVQIKRIRTRLSNEEIKTQPERENPAITIKEGKRITSKAKGPKTVIVITIERYDVLG